MENTRFWNEFLENTNYQYNNLLKFNNASFDTKNNVLSIKISIDALNNKTFKENHLEEVNQKIYSMFPGLDNINIDYVLTYTDDRTVKNKVLDFFNKNNSLIYNALYNDNNSIETYITDSDLLVKFNLKPHFYALLDSNNSLKEDLFDFLDVNFNRIIEIKINQVEDINNDESIVINTSAKSSGSARLINIKTISRIIAKGNAQGPSFKPSYIKDIKDQCEDVVLCGKITNIAKGEYNNKKYSPDDPKSGPEKKPLVKFLLDDTTGKITTTCFVKEDQINSFLNLPEQSEIVCQGKISLYSKTNSLSFIPHSVFRCEIDYDSIHVIENKPVPDEYLTVFPQQYIDNDVQNSLFESKDDKVLPYFSNKTFVVYDLETTGLSIQNCEIIEIGAIKVVNGIPTETFSTLVKPQTLISKEITDITHIKNEDVLSAPSIENVFPDFYKFIHDSILVGHNISSFDYPFIRKYADKFGYDVNNEIIDTELLAKKYFPDFTKYNLGDLTKALKINLTNAHRAFFDTEATYKLLKEIAKVM